MPEEAAETTRRSWPSHYPNKLKLTGQLDSLDEVHGSVYIRTTQSFSQLL